MELSVVIIARDEADRLAEAIRSVPFADEVLVLDSGSVDGTQALARSLGARVIETDWPGHVAQKNRALAEARCPWVLSIDADERVGERLARAIQQVLAQGGEHDGYEVNRRNHYLGRPLRGGDWYPDRRLRLARREVARWVGQDPHDRLLVAGKVGRLVGDLHHYPYRSLSEHLATIDSYSRRAAEVATARAHWWDVALRPGWDFFRGYVLRFGLQDGLRGLLVAALGATYTLLKWARLYLRQHERDEWDRGCDGS